ncbi:MAG: hypothetical protein IPG76_00125 [Acidobacteria bacterium]|nr:hypothetical protein [Acidobacteriota bacterium]
MWKIYTDMLDAQYNSWVSGLGPDWSTNPAARNAYKEMIREGKGYIEIRNDTEDIGMKLAIPKDKVSLQVRTTLRKGSYLGDANTIDPAAFWLQGSY